MSFCNKCLSSTWKGFYLMNKRLQVVLLFTIRTLRVCKSTLNIEKNIETLKKLTLTSLLSRFSMFLFSTLTLYWLQCFGVNILKNCTMFSMSRCFSMFLNVFNFFPIFFDIIGQKRKFNSNFRTIFTLLIKNRKLNMGLNICLLWTIFWHLKMLTIFEKNCNIETLKSTLKHWKHWIEFNVDILKKIDIALSFNVHFFDIENIESKSMSMSVQTLTYHGAMIPKVCSADHKWSARLAEVVLESPYKAISCALRTNKLF